MSDNFLGSFEELSENLCGCKEETWRPGLEHWRHIWPLPCDFPSLVVLQPQKDSEGSLASLPRTVWGWGGPGTHVVILRTSFMLVSGSELSGQRRRQGAKMMASALGDMRFTSSSRATLRSEQQLGDGREAPH